MALQSLAGTGHLLGYLLETLPRTVLERDGDVWTTRLDVPSDLRAVYWFGSDGEEEWTRRLPDPVC